MFYLPACTPLRLPCVSLAWLTHHSQRWQLLSQWHVPCLPNRCCTSWGTGEPCLTGRCAEAHNECRAGWPDSSSSCLLSCLPAYFVFLLAKPMVLWLCALCQMHLGSILGQTSLVLGIRCLILSMSLVRLSRRCSVEQADRSSSPRCRTRILGGLQGLKQGQHQLIPKHDSLTQPLVQKGSLQPWPQI